MENSQTSLQSFREVLSEHIIDPESSRYMETLERALLLEDAILRPIAQLALKFWQRYEDTQRYAWRHNAIQMLEKLVAVESMLMEDEVVFDA